MGASESKPVLTDSAVMIEPTPASAPALTTEDSVPASVQVPDVSASTPMEECQPSEEQMVRADDPQQQAPDLGKGEPAVLVSEANEAAAGEEGERIKLWFFEATYHNRASLDGDDYGYTRTYGLWTTQEDALTHAAQWLCDKACQQYVCDDGNYCGSRGEASDKKALKRLKEVLAIPYGNPGYLSPQDKYDRAEHVTSRVWRCRSEGDSWEILGTTATVSYRYVWRSTGDLEPATLLLAHYLPEESDAGCSETQSDAEEEEYDGTTSGSSSEDDSDDDDDDDDDGGDA